MSVLFECRLTTNVKQLLSGIGAEFSTNIGEWLVFVTKTMSNGLM